MSKIDIMSDEIKENQKYEKGGVGTHRLTSGPCYGYPRGGSPNDKKWFATRTRLKKAGYVFLEPAYGAKE